LPIVLEKLMVTVRLISDFIFGDAKEDDASASLRRRVATNVGQQGLLHVRRR
jgi:hypothetical protein